MPNALWHVPSLSWDLSQVNFICPSRYMFSLLYSALCPGRLTSTYFTKEIENKEHWQKRQKREGKKEDPGSLLWHVMSHGRSLWVILWDSLLNTGASVCYWSTSASTRTSNRYLCFPHFLSCPHLCKTVSVLNFPAVNSVWGSCWKSDWYNIQHSRNHGHKQKTSPLPLKNHFNRPLPIITFR